jgi:hypothetical protein
MAKKSQKYWAIAEFSVSADHLSTTTAFRLLEGKSEEDLKSAISSKLTDSIGFDEGLDFFSDDDEEEDEDEDDEELTDYDVPLADFACSDRYAMHGYEARVVAGGKIPDDIGTIFSKLQDEFDDTLGEDRWCKTPELRDELKACVKSTSPDVAKIKALLEKLCEASGHEGDARLYI